MNPKLHILLSALKDWSNNGLKDHYYMTRIMKNSNNYIKCANNFKILYIFIFPIKSLIGKRRRNGGCGMNPIR